MSLPRCTSLKMSNVSRGVFGAKPSMLPMVMRRALRSKVSCGNDPKIPDEVPRRGARRSVAGHRRAGTPRDDDEHDDARPAGRRAVTIRPRRAARRGDRRAEFSPILITWARTLRTARDARSAALEPHPIVSERRTRAPLTTTRAPLRRFASRARRRIARIFTRSRAQLNRPCEARSEHKCKWQYTHTQ